MNVSSEARRKDPSLPKVWSARAITYQRKGFRAQTLLTSLVDVDAFPAEEIATLYHERWELELGYDEIKTEMLDREEAIRSKTPAGVTQELWGVFSRTTSCASRWNASPTMPAWRRPGSASSLRFD
jgi:hypothetical protein